MPKSPASLKWKDSTNTWGLESGPRPCHTMYYIIQNLSPDRALEYHIEGTDNTSAQR